MRISELQDSKPPFDLGGHELCIITATLQQPKHVCKKKKKRNKSLHSISWETLRTSEFKNNIYNNLEHGPQPQANNVSWDQNKKLHLISLIAPTYLIWVSISLNTKKNKQTLNNPHKPSTQQQQKEGNE